MTWKEFYSKYPYTVNEYPDTGYLNTDSKVVIRMVKTEQTKNGYTKWHTVSVYEESVSIPYYLNTIEAVPFFKSIGGKERVELKYTKYGRLPSCIWSISPDKLTRTVREFSFE